MTTTERDLFERLALKWTPLIKRLCAKVTNSPEDAEDLRGLVMLKSAKGFHRFDSSKAGFGAWIGAICKSEAANQRRFQRSKIQPLALEDVELEFFNALKAPEQEFHFAPWHDGLELSPRQILAFELTNMRGLTSLEASKIMGCTEGAVRTQCWKAREKMKRTLGERLWEAA